ncbi:MULTISPECIES: hypothetical protein [Cohnella]|uniref:hypothetical protein n=1 Tax=Cohnella TaxID=329857 RepID=UPI0009BC422B|nr:MULTISPECIES: hypothetical protein [Cohnella]MBN2981975.1 hypothetical protein [Cohnella algarum]
MPKYFVDFSDDGDIAGFYVDEIHGLDIPQSALPITTEKWQVYSSNAHLYKLDGKSIRHKTQMELNEENLGRPPLPPSDFEAIGEQIVNRELDVLELRYANQILNQQILELKHRIAGLKEETGT